MASKSSAVTLAAVQADEPQADAIRRSTSRSGGLRFAPAAEVGDHDDRELEALRGVDRHQPHGVEAAEVDGRVGLAGVGLELGGGEVDEAAHVAPAARLEGGRQRSSLWTLASRRAPRGSASTCRS